MVSERADTDAWMEWITDAVDTNHSDEKWIGNKRTIIRESLESVGELAGPDAVDDLGQAIVDTVEAGYRPEAKLVRAEARRIVRDYDVELKGTESICK